MEQVKLKVSIPFRKDGLKEDYPNQIFTFEGTHLNKYYEALVKEMEANKEDNEIFEVKEIEFINGSLIHYGANTTLELFKTIKQNFNVSNDVVVKVHVTPSNLTYFQISSIDQMNRGNLIIEIPSTNDDQLEIKNFPNKEVCLGALDTCFNNSFRRVSVELDNNDPYLEETIKDLIEHHTTKIRFKHNLTQAQQDLITKYHEIVLDHETEMNTLGLGLSAETNINGSKYKNTDNLALYLEHSDDFQAISEIID